MKRRKEKEGGRRRRAAAAAAAVFTVVGREKTLDPVAHTHSLSSRVRRCFGGIKLQKFEISRHVNITGRANRGLSN